MKRVKTQTSLEKITMQQIDMQNYRTALRRALLTSPYWNKKQTNTFLFWKGGEEIMKMRNIATIGIAFSVMAIALISLSIFIPKNAKTAYAQELAQKSYHAVSILTPNEQEILRQKVHMDPRELLQETKNAKDLKVLTYDQFVNQNPEIKMNFSTGGKMADDMPQLPPGPDTQKMDMQNLKFLQFTDTTGQKVILGIDKNDLPVFALSKGKDGNMGFSVQGNPNGAKGPMFRTVSVKEDGKGGSPKKGMSVMQVKDGGNTIIINGKKYTVPAGATISPDEPPTIKVEGNDVYINGIKAIPKE